MDLEDENFHFERKAEEFQTPRKDGGVDKILRKEDLSSVEDFELRNMAAFFKAIVPTVKNEWKNGLLGVAK